MNKNQRLISCLKIVWGIISLIFAIISYINWSTFTGDYENIVNTWKSLPIVDVQIAATCPVDYVALTAYERFPGTTYACDCRPSICATTDSTLSQCSATSLTKGSTCNSTLTVNTCRNFGFQLPAKSLSSWRGMQVCVKRTADSNLNSLNRVHVYGNQSCPLGWISCRNTTIFNPTSNEETVCTLPGQTCPITSVKIVPTTQVNTVPFCTETRTFNHIRTGISYTACIQRAGARPSVDLGFFRNLPCSSYGSAAWTSSSRDNDDIREGSSYSCSKPDTRWNGVDTMQEAGFYSDNLIPDAYVKNMTSSLLTPINHMAQPEIQWYQSCPVTRNSFAQAEKQVKTIFQCAIGVLVLSSIAGISGMFLSYQAAKGRTEEEVMVDGGYKHHFCILIINLAKVIPLAIALHDSRSVESIFRSLRDVVCTDSFSDETVKFLAKEIFNTSWQNILIIISTLITIALTAKDLYTMGGCRLCKPNNSKAPVDHVNMDSVPNEN